MTRDHTGRAGPVGHSEDLLTMYAEQLRTAGELIENLTEGVARARLLVRENHKLRQERASDMKAHVRGDEAHLNRISTVPTSY